MWHVATKVICHFTTTSVSFILCWVCQRYKVWQVWIWAANKHCNSQILIADIFSQIFNYRPRLRCYLRGPLDQTISLFESMLVPLSLWCDIGTQHQWRLVSSWQQFFCFMRVALKETKLLIRNLLQSSITRLGCNKKRENVKYNKVPSECTSVELKIRNYTLDATAFVRTPESSRSTKEMNVTDAAEMAKRKRILEHGCMLEGFLRSRRHWDYRFVFYI